MKASEYGGYDTDKTSGIQPFPHKLTATERLRLMYGTDPLEQVAEPIPGLDPEQI